MREASASPGRFSFWAKIPEVVQIVLVLIAVFTAGGGAALTLSARSSLPTRVEAIEKAEKDRDRAITEVIRHDTVQDARIAYVLEHGSPAAISTWKMMRCHMKGLTLKQCDELQEEPPGLKVPYAGSR